MATHGSVIPFNPDKEDWSAYVECYYLVANGVTDELDAKKVTILMYKLWTKDYPQPSRWKGIKYNDLISILTAHFNPKPLPIVQRLKFYNCI